MLINVLLLVSLTAAPTAPSPSTPPASAPLTQLYPEVAPEASPSTAPAALRKPRVPDRTPWWVAGIGIATAVIGAAIVDLALGQGHPASNGATTAYAYTWQQAQAANTEGYVGQAVALAGVGVALGGVAWGLFRPSPSP